MLSVKASVAVEYIEDAIKARLVPMVHGSPGVGKSSLVHQIAESFNLVLIDLRLSQCDPTDLNGLPRVLDTNKATYTPMDTFPLSTDKLPAGKDGWLLFLDEFNSAPPAVQKAAYKLTLDRMVGTKHLHKNVAIVCAGNLETDGALVSPLSTANQSRLVHMELHVDHKDWLEWAQSNDIDYRITAYINFRPSCLQKFDPDHSDRTFACPRTWEFTSRLISLWDGEIPSSKINLLAGTLSEGVAREFVNFSKVFLDLPTVSSIASNPSVAHLPEEPSTLYAMSAVLADNITQDTVTPFLEYVDRMPKEFQIITIREMSRRYPEIETSPRFVNKVAEIATYL